MVDAVTITGSQQVISNLNNLDSEAKKLIKAAMQTAADRVVSTAKSNAPVDTGYLRSQIMVDSVTETEAKITSHAEYSIYQKVDFMGDALSTESAAFTQSLQKVYNQVWQSAS